MSEESRELACDLAVESWRVLESDEFRRVTGKNPQAVLNEIVRAWNESVVEMRARFGDVIDSEDWSPPDGYVPDSVLDIPTGHLLGFAWIPHWRRNRAADFEAWAAEISVKDFDAAFWEALVALVEDNRRPKAKRKTHGRAASSGSRSAPSFTGLSETSISSPSANAETSSPT